MSGAEFLAAMADFLTVATGLAVLIQLRIFIRQLRFDAGLRVLTSNRELIRQGMDDEELLEVISMKDGVSLNRKQRYAQLWINQMQMIFDANEYGFVGSETWASLERDVSDFAQLPAVQNVWSITRAYYPRRFREFVDAAIKQSA